MAPRDHFRAHARRRVALVATLEVCGNRSGRREVRVHDLGLGGARLELSGNAPQELDVGAAVSVAITAPTLWDPLVLLGRVAWFRAGDDALTIGVGFQHREGTGLLALFQLIEGRALDG